MAFSKEADFEEAIIKILSERGWEKAVLKNYTEQQLIQNWADILFENNRSFADFVHIYYSIYACRNPVVLLLTAWK